MLTRETRELYRLLVGVLIAAFGVGIIGLVVHALVFGASVQYYDLSSAREFTFFVEPRPSEMYTPFLLGFTLSYLPTFALIIMGVQLIAWAMLPPGAGLSRFVVQFGLSLSGMALMVTWACFVGLELYVTRGSEQQWLLQIHRLATYAYYALLYALFIVIGLRGVWSPMMPRFLYGLAILVGVTGLVFASVTADPEQSPFWLIIGNVTGLALFMAPLGAYLVLLLSATDFNNPHTPTYHITRTPPTS